jgi:hypothetical protein
VKHVQRFGACDVVGRYEVHSVLVEKLVKRGHLGHVGLVVGTGLGSLGQWQAFVNTELNLRVT